jgi:DNA-binding NtrC family response regulator
MTARIYRFPARGRKPGPVAKPVRVLLIVGQDEWQELLTDALVKAGCDVTPHRLDPRYYPAELLGLFEKERFDVVIPTNLGIPFVYVPDLVSLAQKFAKGAGVLVVSGWIQDDFIAEMSKIPRTAFLAVPVKLEEFVAKVKELAGMGPSGEKKGLPRVLVLLADAKGNQVAQCFFDWLVARYRGVLDIRGAVQDSSEEFLRIASTKHIHLFVVNFTALWVPGAPFRGHMDFAGHLKTRFGRPVVMLSGFEDAIFKGQAIAAGVDAYFRLPLQLDEIGAVMDKLLNVKGKA